MANVRLSDGTVVTIPEGISWEEEKQLLKMADPEGYAQVFPAPTTGEIAKETLKGLPRGLLSVPEMGFKGVGALAETQLGGGLIGDVLSKGLRYTGEAFEKVSKDFIGERTEASDTFPAKVGEAVGQIGGFMASSLINPLAPFVAGSAMMAEQAYQDIQRFAHTPEDKQAAVGWAAIFGTTEGIPIHRALNRLGTEVKNRLIGALVKGGKAGFEEAIQEATQEGLMNFMASDLVGYDEDRELLDGLAEAASVGGTAGFIANLILSALTGGKRSVKPPDKKESSSQADPEQIEDLGTTEKGVIIDPTETVDPLLVDAGTPPPPQSTAEGPQAPITPEAAQVDETLSNQLPRRLITPTGDTLSQTVHKQLRAALVPTEDIAEHQLDQYAQDVMTILQARAASAQESLDQYIFRRGLSVSPMAYDPKGGRVFFQADTPQVQNIESLEGTLLGSDVPLPGFTGKRGEILTSEHIQQLDGLLKDSDQFTLENFMVVPGDLGNYTIIAPVFKAQNVRGQLASIMTTQGNFYNIISLFQSQRPSTVIHELGHLFSNDLRGAELAVVNKWLGYDPLTVPHDWESNQQNKGQEKFARAFERYLYNGKVPGNDSMLREAFNRIKEVMRRVYAILKGSPIKYNIPPNVAKVFDRLMKPDGMPTFLPERQMTFENWKAFQGDMLADLAGVADGAMAVQRPTYLQTLIQNIRRSVFYARPSEVAGRLAIMEATETSFLTNPALTLEDKMSRAVSFMIDMATDAFHKKHDMEQQLETLENTLENRQPGLTPEVISKIQSGISYIKRLQDYREMQEVFKNSLRQGLLEIQEQVGEPIFLERTTGRLFRVDKKSRGGTRLILAPLEGLDRRPVGLATLATDFVSPEALHPRKDWTLDRESYILEKHREMIDEALMDGKEDIPSYALAPHINTDPVYQNAYNDALLREEAKTRIIEQRGIIEEWKADLAAANPMPPVEPISQINKDAVDNLNAPEIEKRTLATIAGFVDQSFFLLERLSNALDKDSRIKFLDVIPKAELQKLTSLRGDVGSATARDYLANLFQEMDAIKDSIESGKIDTTNHEQLATVLDRTQGVYSKLEAWEKRFKESGQADMLEPGKTESMVNKLWDWFEKTMPFVPEAAGTNTIAMGIRKAVMGMHWMARRYPVLLPLARAGGTQRLVNATLQANQLLNGMEQAETIEISNRKGEVRSVTVQAPGLRTFRSMPSRGPVYVALQHLLLTSDALEKRFTTEELRALMDKAKEVKSAQETRPLTESEKDAIIRAYNEVQGTMEYMYYKLYQTLERQFGDRRAASVLQTLYPKGYIEGYFPHVRRGKYAVAVKNPESGETEYFSMYDRAVDQKAALRRLREKNPNSTVVAVDPTDRINYQYGGGVDLVTAIQDVIAKADLHALAEGPEQAQQIEAALDKATAAIIKSHGMFSMFGERRNVPGFDERVGQVVIDRVKDFGAALAKIEFAKKGTEEIAKLRSTPQLYNYAQDWFGAMLQSADHHDNMIQQIRSLIFFKYLGASVKTAFVVFADKITNTPARLGLHTQGAEKKLIKGMGEAVRFMSWHQQVEKLANSEGISRHDAIKRIPLPEGFTPEKINATLWSLDAGVSTAKFVPEILRQEETTWEVGSGTTAYGRAMDIASVSMQKAFNVSAYMLTKVESFNRLSTFITGYDVFRGEKGFSYDDALLNAQDLVNDSHFLYGKPNIPLFMQRKGLGKWLKVFYTFRSYEHNYVQMLGDLMFGKGRQGKLMAAKSLTYLVALAGVPALPFFSALSKAFGLFGNDPEQEVLASLYKMDAPEFLSKAFSDGIPGMFDTTFRGSLQIGAYENLEDIIAGVAGSAVTDLARGSMAMYRGDWDSAMRTLAPTAMANIYKAGQGREHGVMSTFGTPLREGVIGPQIKYTDAEFLQKLLSFNPRREAETHRIKKAMRTSDKYWRDRRQSAYSKFAKAIRTDDKAGLAAAFADIRTYEKDRLGQGAIEVPAIDKQSLRQSLEESGLRRREILQVLRVTGQLHGM